MTTRLTVATRCPTCGAELDFGEGSNAVRCGFCRSNLLVTGRKHVLAYSIAPTLTKHRAIARVMLAHKEKGHPCRVVKPQLYFIPYYRLTGHDLRWERMAQEVKPRSANRQTRNLAPVAAPSTANWLTGDPFDEMPSLFELLAGAVREFMGGLHTDSGMGATKGAARQVVRPKTKGHAPRNAASPRHHASSRGGPVQLVLHDRYVEKNFIATDLSGPRVYSLGVRPTALRLNLYHHDELAALGTIVAPRLTPSEALERGLMTANAQSIVFRRVFGRVLSLIYFPYWVIETERRGKRALTVVDAVSEDVLKLDEPMTLYDALTGDGAEHGQTVGFRPLVCPNCGWDFPVRPDDVIFTCSACHRAWQMYRDMLYEVAFQVAAPPEARRAAPAAHLPFWRMTVAAGDDPARELIVPAFRYRRLKVLKHLAVGLSKTSHAIEPLTGHPPGLHGCFYDQEDAVLLAQAAYISLSANSEKAVQILNEHRFVVRDIVLTWLPFYQNGASLAAPFTGQHLLPQLLV